MGDENQGSEVVLIGMIDSIGAHLSGNLSWRPSNAMQEGTFNISRVARHQGGAEGARSDPPICRRLAA